MVPFGPCATVPAGEGIPAAWLAPGSELDPAIVARASRLTAVAMDMTGGYAKSVRHHAPQAIICIDPYHVVQLANQALDEVRRAYWNELRSLGEKDAAKRFKDARWSLLKRTREAHRQASRHARPDSEPPAARYGAPTHSRKPSAASSNPDSASRTSRS